MENSQYFRFRIISYLEGLSYLVLIFIAMPLKYLDGNLIYMKVIGMLHGFLFILFCLTLFTFSKRWNLKKEISFDYFIYSLSPFGFLLIENDLKEKSYDFEK